MSFSIETEKESKFSFLDVEIIREQPQIIENLLSVAYIVTMKFFTFRL